MNILITICGRGGSKGIPGKNIRVLNGKPLIGYSIDVAKEFGANKNVVVALSSDSAEIIGVAADLGLETTYRRPTDLATDTSGKLPVIADLLNYEEKNRNVTFDYVIDLDITSPLRTAADLDAALQLLEDKQEALNLFSVNPANRNPYFNMVEEDGRGFYQLCKKGSFLTRQSAPKVYDLNASFYIYRRCFFDANVSVINDKSLVYVMPHTCFDLDHPIDFDFMEYLMSGKKLDFIL